MQYHIHNNRQLKPILRQMNALHILTPYSFNI